MTVAAGVARTDRSQVPACRSRTCPIAVASASASAILGSAVIAASRSVPRVRAYQATPCRHPVSAPRGVVVQPSKSTAAAGPTHA